MKLIEQNRIEQSKEEWAIAPGHCSITFDEILYLCRKDVRLGWICESVANGNRVGVFSSVAVVQSNLKSLQRISDFSRINGCFALPANYRCPGCGDTQQSYFQCLKCRSLNCWGGVSKSSTANYLKAVCGGCHRRIDSPCEDISLIDSVRRGNPEPKRQMASSTSPAFTPGTALVVRGPRRPN